MNLKPYTIDEYRAASPLQKQRFRDWREKQRYQDRKEVNHIRSTKEYRRRKKTVLTNRKIYNCGNNGIVYTVWHIKGEIKESFAVYY